MCMRLCVAVNITVDATVGIFLQKELLFQGFSSSPCKCSQFHGRMMVIFFFRSEDYCHKIDVMYLTLVSYTCVLLEIKSRAFC